MLTEALIICLIVFLIILLCFYIAGRITFWSSLAIASLISLILLVLIYPPICLIAEKYSTCCLIYVVLILFFLIIIFFYILTKALVDYRGRCCHCGAETQECEVVESQECE